MRIWILSDIHCRPDEPWAPVSRPDFDVLVAAGDIFESDIERSVSWAARIAGPKPSVYVAGNHEFGELSLEAEIEKGRRRAESEGVVFLDGQGWVEVAGGHFVGSTLWTDLQLNQPAGHLLYPQEFGEPIDVLDAGIDRRARGADIVRMHAREAAAIEQALDEPPASAGPRIVVSHYAPHVEVLTREMWSHPAAAGSASDLGHLTDVGAADLWICGHVHRSVDFVPGYGTRIVSNPRGESGSNPAFDEHFVVEVLAGG